MPLLGGENIRSPSHFSYWGGAAPPPPHFLRLYAKCPSELYIF